MFSAAILDRYRERFFVRCFPVFYFFFVASFFFLSTRWHRNFYYLFIVVPFLLFIRLDVLRTLRRSKVLLLALAYCLYMLLSLGWAIDLAAGQMFDYVRMALLVLVFLAATACLFASDRRHLGTLYRSVSWTAGVMAVASVVWFSCFHPVGRIVGIGTLNSPIIAGSGYAAAALMGYGSFLSRRESSAGKRVLSLLPVLTAITFVILTQSRGPLLALAAVMALGTLLARPKGLPWVLGCFSLSFAVALALRLFTFTDLLERGGSYRLTIWRQSLEIIGKHPWLGYGLGGKRPEIVIELGPLSHSHDLFLSNMVDGGACALLLVLSLLLLAFYWAVRCFRLEGDVTLLSLVAFSVAANLTDGKTLIVSPNYQWLYFWLPVALVAAHELRASTGSIPLPDSRLQTGMPGKDQPC